MKIQNLLLWLVLLPFWAQADDLYHIQRLSESELARTYAEVMLDACHHADGVWQDWGADPRGGYWGTGRSDQGNEGIRAIAEMTLTCGALLKYTDVLPDPERQKYLGKVRRAIYYATSSHLTGPLKCTDGKPWGGSWQSAMWTATLGFGAWLVWNDLDADLQKKVERVLASEADRFLQTRPPGGSTSDTKAEENGWNMICLVVAANMFPKHAHAAQWNEKGIEYMMNTLSVEQDLNDTTTVDGRAVKDWVVAENVHPDFTLENHGFFHPAYVGCSSYFLTQAAMYYTYAGRPVPQATRHHLLDVWAMFRHITLPWGEPAYPQGMDWELHGINFINLYASLATLHKDPLAARLEQNCLQYVRAWQVMQNGDMAVPGSKLGFTRHAICAEQATYGFLAHKVFGPSANELGRAEIASQAHGVRCFNYADFITHRTNGKFVSFSWKNRLMGLFMPIGRKHAGNPHFTVPIMGGLFGSIETAPAGDKTTKVLEHSWKELPNGFETTGTLLLNGGSMKQKICVTSVGERTLVYQDQITAVSDVSVSRELGVPLGIENDRITGGKRVLRYTGGERTFDFEKPEVPFAIPGSWANVDDRLGIITVAGSGLAYRQASGYDPHTAVCADVIYGSFSEQPRHFKAGEQVAHRVVVFYAEVTANKTAELVDLLSIEKSRTTQVFRLKLPEGGKAEIRSL